MLSSVTIKKDSYMASTGILDVATFTKDKEIRRKHSGYGSEVEKKIQKEY